MRKLRRIILAYTLIMTFLFLSSSLASATITSSPPKTHSWQFIYDADGNNLNTTPDAYNAATKQGLMGYDAHYGTNYGATTVLNDMIYDAIFYYSGHGGPGNLWLFDGTNYSFIYGQNGTNAISNFTSTDINRLKLAVLDGCKTALTDATHGNLLEQLSYLSNNHGVDCALGFTVTIGQCNWGSYFWKYMQQGKTVAQSANDAAWDVWYYNNNNYLGYDHYSIVGNRNETLTPAAYGSTTIP